MRARHGEITTDHTIEEPHRTKREGRVAEEGQVLSELIRDRIQESRCITSARREGRSRRETSRPQSRTDVPRCGKDLGVAQGRRLEDGHGTDGSARSETDAGSA